jgi:ATP-dependent DNA ligase I
MDLAQIAATPAAVAATSSRLGKIELLASCLLALGPAEVPVAVAYLSGELPGGALGVGWAAMRDLPAPAPAPPTVTLLETQAALGRIRSASGPGSQGVRRRELSGLFARLTDPEQRFLRRLMSGELRQGALGGVMVEAAARAAGVPVADLRRAVLVSGDLAAVAAAAVAEGREGLAGFRLTPGRPLRPMLAQTAAGPVDAMARIAEAASVAGGPEPVAGAAAGVEWKFDGVRVQVHRSPSGVAVFTCNLAEVTDRVPEVVEAIEALPVASVVLDGELIGLRPDGRPRRFQETMGRFGSRVDVVVARKGVPLSLFAFDCLHLDGRDLIDHRAAERFAALADALPPALVVPRIVTGDPRAVEGFLDEALAAGHEGVMVKSLDAPYEAGRRGAGWLKVKRAQTLDLVVLAAEWGHGRRRGRLSNLHLGARDAVAGDFVMLGKTFKGMTDEMLVWQTDHLLSLEVSRDAYTVYVRPELVVEVAFDGLQDSSRYPGGLALRFARIKRYRADKTADQADTMETVRAIHQRSP